MMLLWKYCFCRYNVKCHPKKIRIYIFLNHQVNYVFVSYKFHINCMDGIEIIIKLLKYILSCGTYTYHAIHTECPPPPDMTFTGGPGFWFYRGGEKDYVRTGRSPVITVGVQGRPLKGLVSSRILDALSFYSALFWSILIQNGIKTNKQTNKHSQSKQGVPALVPPPPPPLWIRQCFQKYVLEENNRGVEWQSLWIL